MFHLIKELVKGGVCRKDNLNDIFSKLVFAYACFIKKFMPKEPQCNEHY
jgi:hypothetical protein